MIKYNTFEFSKNSFLHQCSLTWGALVQKTIFSLVHIKGIIGTQRVYINKVRNIIKKECNLNKK